MDNDIYSGVSFKSVYFDFISTYYVGSSVIQNGRNPYFEQFRCHYPLMTYLSMYLLFKNDNILFKRLFEIIYNHK